MSQEIIDQGQAAETLLAHDAFGRVVKGLMDSYVGLFFSSDPDDETARATAYHSARAVQDIINTLNQQVAMKDQVLAAAEENKEE